VKFIVLTKLSNSDFLLFIPTNGRASPLEAAYSFYTSVVRLTAEGDSVVSDETLQGLGMSGSFLRTLFGSLVKLASPDPRFPYRPLELRLPFFTRQRGHDLERPTTLFTTARPTTPPPTHSYTSASSPIVAPRAAASFEAKGEGTESLDFAGCTEADMAASFHESSPLKGLGQQPVDRTPSPHLGKLQKAQKAFATEKSRLTSYLPEPGYFLVGAVAGALSRTATAPLDRLKVYLLVSTKTGANIALDAAKHGHPLAAIVGAVRPIGEAIRCLYRIGGLRTFFAGQLRSIDGQASP
jgi:solute carrier family 25 phosphate transporter 23/24/25/41